MGSKTFIRLSAFHSGSEQYTFLFENFSNFRFSEPHFLRIFFRRTMLLLDKRNGPMSEWSNGPMSDVTQMAQNF